MRCNEVQLEVDPRGTTLPTNPRIYLSRSCGSLAFDIVNVKSGGSPTIIVDVIRLSRREIRRSEALKI